MEHIATPWIWMGFSVFVLMALSLDTFLLDKKYVRPQASLRAALYWSLVWITCAFIFNGLLWLYLYFSADLPIANEKAMDFLAGYLIEKSLSIDNLFAFYIVFHQLRIPLLYQQRVFSYGIWSAIVLRLVLILLGVYFVEHFHWLLYVMGAFLLLMGIKLFFNSEKEKQLSEGLTMRMMKRFFRVTQALHEHHFFIRKNHLLYVTPLLIALILIELSDMIFALDSIPAIFAITTDPFIVWSSNIFAILGLRALYFLLAGMMHRVRGFQYGIALILVFVGSKMVIEPWIVIPTFISLSVIIVILLGFAGLSLLFESRQEK